MPDMKKVIKGLKCIASSSDCIGTECPYCHNILDNAITGYDCTTELARDILALLKEQPAIVRCKDCGHQGKRGLGAYCMFIECKKTGSIHHETWFCANGERR